MKSMTGFGYKELNTDKFHLGVNIKSYNNRYLDVVINLPVCLNTLEPLIREFILTRVKRGRVEIALKMKEIEEELAVYLDDSVVSAYMKAVTQLKETTGIEEPIKLSHLLRFDGVIKSEPNFDVDKYWAIIEPILTEAYKDFDLTRSVEGERTEEIILDLITKVQSSVELIEKYVPKIEEKVKASLKKRFFELMGDEIDTNRVYAETAVLLIKFDITEELMRLKSHVKSFFEIIKEGVSVSKKLDFICQELNREINTIGSKNIMLEVSQSVITIKDQIESIRELLRNVE
ncbi:MAG: YicC family protein [Spirochaetales bacterium]|nr:YicC family protein [Spirochaetales bacterium]